MSIPATSSSMLAAVVTPKRRAAGLLPNDKIRVDGLGLPQSPPAATAGYAMFSSTALGSANEGAGEGEDAARHVAQHSLDADDEPRHRRPSPLSCSPADPVSCPSRPSPLNLSCGSRSYSPAKAKGRFVAPADVLTTTTAAFPDLEHMREAMREQRAVRHAQQRRLDDATREADRSWAEYRSGDTTGRNMDTGQKKGAQQHLPWRPSGVAEDPRAGVVTTPRRGEPPPSVAASSLSRGQHRNRRDDEEQQDRLTRGSDSGGTPSSRRVAAPAPRDVAVEHFISTRPSIIEIGCDLSRVTTEQLVVRQSALLQETDRIEKLLEARCQHTRAYEHGYADTERATTSRMRDRSAMPVTSNPVMRTQDNRADVIHGDTGPTAYVYGPGGGDHAAPAGDGMTRRQSSPEPDNSRRSVERFADMAPLTADLRAFAMSLLQRDSRTPSPPPSSLTTASAARNAPPPSAWVPTCMEDGAIRPPPPHGAPAHAASLPPARQAPPPYHGAPSPQLPPQYYGAAGIVAATSALPPHGPLVRSALQSRSDGAPSPPPRPLPTYPTSLVDMTSQPHGAAAALAATNPRHLGMAQALPLSSAATSAHDAVSAAPLSQGVTAKDYMYPPHHELVMNELLRLRQTREQQF